MAAEEKDFIVSVESSFVTALCSAAGALPVSQLIMMRTSAPPRQRRARLLVMRQHADCPQTKRAMDLRSKENSIANPNVKEGEGLHWYM